VVGVEGPTSDRAKAASHGEHQRTDNILERRRNVVFREQHAALWQELLGHCEAQWHNSWLEPYAGTWSNVTLETMEWSNREERRKNRK
jgi:hypothetical protein